MAELITCDAMEHGRTEEPTERVAGKGSCRSPIMSSDVRVRITAGINWSRTSRLGGSLKQAQQLDVGYTSNSHEHRREEVGSME